MVESARGGIIGGDHSGGKGTVQVRAQRHVREDAGYDSKVRALCIRRFPVKETRRCLKGAATRVCDQVTDTGVECSSTVLHVHPTASPKNLTDVDATNIERFPLAFEQAMTRTSRINFDITGLIIDQAWAEGPKGIVDEANVTNFEFYQIMTLLESLTRSC